MRSILRKYPFGVTKNAFKSKNAFRTLNAQNRMSDPVHSYGAQRWRSALFPGIFHLNCVAWAPKPKVKGFYCMSCALKRFYTVLRFAIYVSGICNNSKPMYYWKTPTFLMFQVCDSMRCCTMNTIDSMWFYASKTSQVPVMLRHKLDSMWFYASKTVHVQVPVMLR